MASEKEQLAMGRGEIASAKEKWKAGGAEGAENQAKVDEGKAQLEEGKNQLSDGEKQIADVKTKQVIGIE